MSKLGSYILVAVGWVVVIGMLAVRAFAKLLRGERWF